MKHRSRRRKPPRIVRRTPPGTSPGTLQVDPGAPQPAVRLSVYGPEEWIEQDLSDVEEALPFLGRDRVVWVHVNGLGDTAVLKRLGELFHLHNLAMEDVVNVHQTSKVEDYSDHLFIVLRRILLGEHVASEQVSLFLGNAFVLTFQERGEDGFAPVRARLREPRGRLRTSGPDYLAYALIDAVIDAYYPALELVGDRLDALEEAVLTGTSADTMHAIHSIKGDLLLMRRAIWPLREAIGVLSRGGRPLIADGTLFYLRDCYDHVVQLLELLETYHELTADLRDLFMSAVNNRINDTMRVLTIISTIFMPLTFIAGVYGMNFSPDASPWNMPELRWRWGYLFALALMGAATLGMLRLFRKKGWLGRGGGA